jgi:hypothetical protein
MVALFDVFYLLLLLTLSYMVVFLVIPYFLNKIKKYKYGIMVGDFFAKNGKMDFSYGNGRKSFFRKIW